MKHPFLVALAGLVPLSATADSVPQPRFVVLPNHYKLAPRHPSNTLPQWSGSFTDLTHKRVGYTMVGADPSQSNASTTVPVIIVPFRMAYGKTNGNTTFDPSHVLANGRTVVKNTVVSPVFQGGIDFIQGRVDLGNTQYLDAYQRGNFWYNVRTNTDYHILLSAPTVLTERTITVAAGEGKVIDNPFGPGRVGTMDINDFDTQVQSYIYYLRSKINPGVLPVFLTYDVFLTSGTCCIGGYHSANGAPPGGQTYAYATYVDSVGSFAQDVSALSHEVGEWIDDPFVDNSVNCSNDNQLMEVGDPLENDVNYGAYPYVLDGFTYNLQSLVFLDYFGAPPDRRVNGWYSFQDDEGGVCPGQ